MYINGVCFTLEVTECFIHHFPETDWNMRSRDSTRAVVSTAIVFVGHFRKKEMHDWLWQICHYPKSDILRLIINTIIQ
jgi:hypothetical protein